MADRHRREAAGREREGLAGSGTAASGNRSEFGALVDFERRLGICPGDTSAKCGPA